MITGFNTDVQYQGLVYHVQTEDRGRDNPVFESLVYIGGSVIAKKRTPYKEQLNEGASEEAIALLLKRQHQVIIAAIKAGRIDDLAKLSTKEQADDKPVPVHVSHPVLQFRAVKKPKTGELGVDTMPSRPARPSTILTGEHLRQPAQDQTGATDAPAPKKRVETKSLDLDQVIADYLKKNEEQTKLDLKVLSPEGFIAGKNINLKVHVSSVSKNMSDAVVTIKVIGTAFRPQVFIGRAGKDGVANFSIALPLFNAGTAAIVIEAQTDKARGELKHLIRKA